MKNNTERDREAEFLLCLFHSFVGIVVMAIVLWMIYG